MYAGDHDQALRVLTLCGKSKSGVVASELLHVACRDERLGADAVSMCLKAGADVHDQCEDALLWSCRRGCVDIVQVLLQGGADVHHDEEMPLSIAINRGHVGLISTLVCAGADMTNQYLGVCYKSLAESLVTRHSSSNAADCIALILSLGSSSSSSAATIRAFANFGLVLASACGACEEAVRWVTRGADVHYMNDQALGLAAAAGCVDVVDQLLALGAYIRADNDAALRLACNHRHIHVLPPLAHPTPNSETAFA